MPDEQTEKFDQWAIESWPPHSDDKYGRWLMAIYVPHEGFMYADDAQQFVRLPDGSDYVCFDLASQLVAEGLGEWREF